MTNKNNTNDLTYLRPEVAAIKETLDLFVEECISQEKNYLEHIAKFHGAARWTAAAVPPCLNRLKDRAKQLGLWNLFIPIHLIDKVPDASLRPKVALTFREYGILCESLGRCPMLAPEACNTSAPDTGNMEVLLEFGTPEQQERYLLPLLRGDIRSAFLMTEPNVASSDPTNLQTKLVKKPNGCYELSGTKWWSTGAMDPRCRVALVVAKVVDNKTKKTRASMHKAHTIVAIDLPNPQVKFLRALTVFGYDDAPHGHAEVQLDRVHVRPTDLILGEGAGFEISQARLGPGRIHHCMRAVGIAYRCYEMMLQRVTERKTFGKFLYEHGATQEVIADSYTDLKAARLLTLSCAAAMDRVGAKQARQDIASIKCAVPALTLRVVDRAVQVFGGAGVNDPFLASAFAGLRTLRIADGPDAVHKRTVAKLEVRRAKL